MASVAGSVLEERPTEGPKRAARKPWRFRLAAFLVTALGAGLVWWAARPAHIGRAAAAESGVAVPAQGAATEKGEPRRRSGADRPVPVQVARAKASDVQVAQLGLGTVLPRQSVTVRSRVTGQLVRVLFKEGELVKPTQLLAEVDPRPLQAQLEQVEGQLARDRALLKNAELDLERFRGLAANVIAKQQVDAQDSLVHQYAGTVRSDEGLVGAARLQVSFTRITAPIGGRIGLRLLDGGNYINAGDPAGIAVINTVQPICVVFSLPEDRVPSVLKALKQARHGGGSLSVQAWDRDSKSVLATGTLLTLDNQIDPATGTVKLKAEFSNEDGALYPNQFVNVRLLLETLRGATVAPTTAIQRGTQGSFVYALNPDNAVTVRPVALGPVDGDNVEIASGLAPGDLVVTNGADKLREGIKVQAQGLGAPDASAPLGRRLAERRGPPSQTSRPTP